MAATEISPLEKRSEAQLWSSSLLVRLRREGAVALIYFAATWFTNASFMGDTSDYVESLLTRVEFWEFGHLLWRPLGWIVFQILGPFANPGEPQLGATQALMAINWVAGLGAALLLRAWLSRITGRERIAMIGAICFIFSQGFLNFTQTGSSYVPGLTLFLLGLFILAREKHEGRLIRAAVPAGLALAASVTMWFPYVLAVPAALASPLFLFGFDRRRLTLVVGSALVFAAAVGLAYGAVFIHLGIHDAAALQAWVAASSHNITTGGVTRVVIGLPRSLINMGNDGVTFKRFLVHDPLNPVSLADLFRLGLWKLGLFYLMTAAVFVNLLRSRQGRRVALLVAAGAMPLLVFAARFDGGAVERYLPIYPLIFLGLSCSLLGERSRPSLRYTALTFFAVATVANVGAHAVQVLDRRQDEAADRIKLLAPLLTPDSRLVVINQQDELVTLRRTFPFNPLVRSSTLRIHPIVSVNTAQVDRWRENFAALTLSAWERGGDVWVSKRVLSERPLAEWNWVEGDDRRVGWNDIHTFFSSLERGLFESGGDDGFMLLAASEKNEMLLRRFVGTRISGGRPGGLQRQRRYLDTGVWTSRTDSRSGNTTKWETSQVYKGGLPPLFSRPSGLEECVAKAERRQAVLPDLRVAGVGPAIQFRSSL